jgi:uncharacterized spore protein YtfJ
MDPDHILQGTQDALTARRVFGEPIHAEGATILPVAVIGGAGGGGNGAKNGKEGGGVGFGLHARPAGVYVIKDGNATWRPAINVNWIVAGGQLVAIAGIFALRSFFSSRRAKAD